MIVYELWETRSRNMIASFAAEEDALAFVARSAEKHGVSSIASVELVRLDDEDDDGPIERIAAGAELLRRARVAA
jgi:hypothetical protein